MEKEKNIILVNKTTKRSFFFFYNFSGDYMKIYLDIIFLINFFFDFLLLFSVNYFLKRNVKFRKILFGALVGALSIFLLFFNINSFVLFLFKIIISVLMILITFSFHNKKYFIKNIITLYVFSIFLGGGLYFINNEFSYDKEGLVFFNNGFSINVIVMLICSPIIIYLYIKDKSDNKKYNNVHEVDIYYDDKKYSVTGFLDTGNNLKDPYKKRGVIILNREFSYNYEDLLYVPYKTIGNNGVLKCVKTDKVLIDKKYELYNLLVGFSTKADISGVECILPNIIKEEIE